MLKSDLQKLHNLEFVGEYEAQSYIDLDVDLTRYKYVMFVHIETLGSDSNHLISFPLLSGLRYETRVLSGGIVSTTINKGVYLAWGQASTVIVHMERPLSNVNSTQFILAGSGGTSASVIAVPMRIRFTADIAVNYAKVVIYRHSIAGGGNS